MRGNALQVAGWAIGAQPDNAIVTDVQVRSGSQHIIGDLPAMATVSRIGAETIVETTSGFQTRHALDAPTMEGLASLLDITHRQLANLDLNRHDIRLALDHLILSLRELKYGATDAQWEIVVETCRGHPITELLHEDPFTRRAFTKPRGYAGDAVLLDYIYSHEEMWQAPKATTMGHRVFDYTVRSPAAEGVRARRGFVADMIDELAVRTDRPHVLSIAAGHLREASLAAAVKRRKLGRFTALDSDESSLDEVRDSYGCFGVETVPARIKHCLTGKLDLGRYDFIYSIGLLDYLGEKTGRRLVSNLFRMLRPRGQLLVANFLPYVRDVGYMETFMDWKLTYRSRQEMIGLTMEVPQTDIQDISIFAEENQNIIFLKITRN